jgi:hypothetical protein
MPDSEDEVSLLTIIQYCLYWPGVMTMEIEFAGTKLQIATISLNYSFVAALDSVGALYVPSNTAFNAGVFAVYPKC